MLRVYIMIIVVGLVGGVVVYVCCLGYGCGKVADKLEDRRNQKEK